MARITIRQVADAAGVSAGTASLVLNGRAKDKRLSDLCVRRVTSAARKLGYHGSYHARTLLRGRSMTLGFITRFHELDPARPGIETGLASEANRRGYEILNIASHEGYSGIERAIDYVSEGRIDGFAVFMGGWTNSDLSRSFPTDIPATHVWFVPDGFEPVVTVDAAPGIQEAVKYLAQLGHRTIAWVGMKTPDGIQVPQRLAAFRQSAQAAGIQAIEHFMPLPIRRPRHTDCTVSSFHEQFCGDTSFLRNATAAICYNDTMATALGLILREKGVGIPQDISLVGFDDTQAIYAVPPLTTISHMFIEMGVAAVDYLDQIITTGAKRKPSVIRIPSRLVIRKSTGPMTAPEEKIR